jgi:uncharacterized delta-60 repeat protein
VTTVIEDWSYCSSLALQPDGKIVVAGSASASPTKDETWRLALARYRSTGSLDPSFGTDGIVITSFGFEHGDRGHSSVALQPDGKIVVAGQDDDFSVSPEVVSFELARYTRTGTLDAGFGEGGLVRTHIGLQSWANAVALQADGKIVAGGVTEINGVGGEPTVARYQTDGLLDPSFGTNGIASAQAPSEGSGIALVALGIQPDGRIVTAGNAYFQRKGDEAFMLDRFLGDASYLVKVRKRSGRGRVISKPAAISCGQQCRAWFGGGSHVRLIAKPHRGWRVRWHGACRGHNRRCVLRIHRDLRAIAVFYKARGHS